MKSSRIAVLVALVTFAAAAQSVTYSVATDWSDTNNPIGTWSYGNFSGTSFSPFSLHVPNYINVGPVAFTGAQPAWTACVNTGNNGCPEGLARSTGIAAPGKDFPIGRVGGHTPLNGWLAVQWTAPSAGTVNLSGSTWMWQDIGRTLLTSVLVNGVQLFAPTVIPTQASGTTSANPLTFAQAATNAGVNPNVFQGLTVNPGTTITWVSANAAGSEDWFVGVDMVVVFTPVPEVSSQFMLALGICAILPLARRRGSA